MLTSGGTDSERAVAPYLTGVRGDVLLYGVSAALAAGLAVVTIYHGHRVWGVVAAVAYAAAAAATLAGRGTAGPRRRAVIAGAVFALTALLPLAVLVVQRVHGVPWSAQPEVEVVERMARLLVDTGTPYAAADTLVRYQDYTPYLPAMAVFGLPRAVFGDGGLTDARLAFLVVSALLVLLAARLCMAGHPGQVTPRVPVRAVHLVAVLPATTLTVATGGDDLPVLALLVLCVVCCQLGRTGAGGVAGGLALAMKLTAAPVLLVLAIALRSGQSTRDGDQSTRHGGQSTRRGGQGARRAVVFTATALGLAAALVLPAVLTSPAALVEHVIRFPAGLTGVESPAASPLPGHLLAETGSAGHLAALALLALAAIAVLVWVLWRPPRDPAEAAERAAVGLVIAMLLMPATRFGYLVYPLVLAGTAIALRSCAPAPTSSSSWSLRRDRAR